MFRKLPPALILALLATSTAYAGEIREVKDLIFQTDPQTRALDLYLPEGDGPHPIVVMLHGGGWKGGSKSGERYGDMARTLAQNGIAVASVDYGLVPERLWPAQIEDIHNALRYLAKNASDYKLDINRLGVIGYSAGGHLSLMTGYYPQPEGLPKVKAIVAFYPITNLATWTDQPSAQNLTDLPLAGNEDKWKDASPTGHVAATNPPTLLIHGKKDSTVNWEQTQELAALLETAKVPHEVIYLEQAPHSFAFATTRKGQPLERDLTPAVVDFFKKYLQ